MDTTKYTTITVRKETSKALRQLALDEDLRMNVLLTNMIKCYKNHSGNLDFIDDDLKEMGVDPKKPKGVRTTKKKA
jgi:hypothetical protein